MIKPKVCKDCEKDFNYDCKSCSLITEAMKELEEI